MPRPRLTEEERKRRRSERYKKWWKNKKAADPDFLKRRAAQQLQRYHFKIENEPGFKESERERSILITLIHQSAYLLDKFVDRYHSQLGNETPFCSATAFIALLFCNSESWQL